MVDQDVVNEVYTELKSLRDEMTAQRENQRMIRLTELLIKLTNIGPEEEKEAAPVAQPSPSRFADHTHVANVFGNACSICKTPIEKWDTNKAA